MANEKTTNEIVKLDGNQLTTQNFFVSQIKKMFAEQKIPLTGYQIKCGNNAVAKMIQMAQQNGRDITSYPQAQTLFTLQNIVSNEWDVLQGEGVIVFQNNAKMVELKDNKGNPVIKDGKVVMKKEYHQHFDLRPTAKGHIKTVRMYAAGTNKANPVALSYVVYEGDEFTDIEYVGVEIKPPVFRPKRLSNRVTHVVYALNMIDGTIQYIVGHREQVKPALIAQAKNNGCPDKDIENMNKIATVDEILNQYEGKTFTKKRYVDSKFEEYETPYFNDTWLQGYNREQMLETKLRGVIANRMIEKEFNNEFQKRAFEHVIVEKPREQLNVDRVNHEEISTEYIEEETGKQTDFKTDKRMTKTLNIQKETYDKEEEKVEDVVEKQDDTVIENEEVEVVIEEPKHNGDKETSTSDDDDDFGAGFGV